MTAWLIGAWVVLAAAPTPAPSGELLYRQCRSCHALEPGANTAAGPTLFGLVGRPIAAERGFNYSPAMRRVAARERLWTRARLDRFLTDPERVVAGIEMSYPGMDDPAERRALIDWIDARSRRAGGR